MKKPLLTSSVAAAVLLFSFSSRAVVTRAAHVGGKQAAVFAGVPRIGDTEAGALREAYHILERADHDYKGHRAHAMHQIAAAARIVGLDLHGGGPGHEAQGTSDEQLRRVRELLQKAGAGMAGKERKHVENAIHSLTIALNVR